MTLPTDPERVVVAVDFSGPSIAAARWVARDLAPDIAAHVEKSTRATGDAILVTETTRRELDPGIRLERLPETPFHGVDRPIGLFRPVRRPGGRWAELPEAGAYAPAYRPSTWSHPGE